MTTGIVLAGGRSHRMGRPKALLKVGDQTFLERAIRALQAGGCEEVVVVLNDADAEVTDLAQGLGGRSTPGAGAGTEQIDSLRAGLRALPSGVSAAVVLPVDHPLVDAATVRALIESFHAGSAPVVVPTHAGRRGHPVLFGASVFDELLHGELPEGARSVIRAHADDLEEVEVGDSGVLVDVDTPDEYRMHFGDFE
ncbi:MAG: nucleotidyltransferase family protein [Gemmatimonadota bacterium]|nr:MAG: nucleotidyltransferase family protein [Gemmatimonadota bacterium]